jgi:hypothetical protein
MWKKCGLLTPAIQLPEAEYERPANWSKLKSNSTRASLTDVEETAQWLAGEDLVQKVVLALLSQARLETDAKSGIVIHNAFAYDGHLERALINAALPRPVCVLSWAQSAEVHAYVKMQITTMLVDQWKLGRGPLADSTVLATDKYCPWDGRQMTAAQPPLPNLKVCKVLDGNLYLPQDVRARYITDVCRGPEWRSLLQQFDRTYSVPDAAAAIVQAPVSVDAPAEPQATIIAEWFPGEPTTEAELTSRYTKTASFDHSSEAHCWFMLVHQDSMPKLFVIAKADMILNKTKMLLGHGGGQWLQDEKAIKHVADHPGKAFTCNFTDDVSHFVVLEGSNGDGDVITLRECLHKMEKDDNVNFTLTNHTFERPQEVIAGTAADSYKVTCTQENGLAWKPHAVKDYKMLNVASAFLASNLAASPALRCVWRMRHYKREAMLAPAKPLWFLVNDLQLAANQVVRLV